MTPLQTSLRGEKKKKFKDARLLGMKTGVWDWGDEPRVGTGGVAVRRGGASFVH